MVKMCKIKELVKEGYSCEMSIIDQIGGGDKCPTVEEFSSNFNKNGASVGVPNVDKRKLFPLQDIVVYQGMEWSGDGEFSELSSNAINGDYTEMYFYVNYFSGDINTLNATVLSLNGEEQSITNLDYYGLAFSISNFSLTNAATNSYMFNVRFTVIDENLFSTNFIGMLDGDYSNHELELTGRGVDGNDSYYDFTLNISDDGDSGMGLEPIGEISISPSYLTLTGYDTVTFDVTYTEMEFSTIRIYTDLNPNYPIEYRLEAKEPNVTSGSAVLIFTAPRLTPEGDYTVILSGSDTNHTYTVSNSVTLSMG